LLSEHYVEQVAAHEELKKSEMTEEDIKLRYISVH
jgi:hypothetical protein